MKLCPKNIFDCDIRKYLLQLHEGKKSLKNDLIVKILDLKKYFYSNTQIKKDCLLHERPQKYK